jgi:hypothetical protein
MRSYFRCLPYRRLVCLLLATSQLYPLPEPPHSARGEGTMTMVQVYPAITETLNS